MEDKRYLTAGEFARISGTTKHTLFHYDEIGLFSPQYRAENKYRYYSVDQLETFDVITTLRELDMPLKQIREYLEQRSPQAFLELLQQEKELVRLKQAQLKSTEKWLEEKANQLKPALTKNMEIPEILKVPEKYLISVYCPDQADMAVAEKIMELYDFCEKNNCKSPYNVGYIQYSDILKQKLYFEYHTIYLMFDNPPGQVSCNVKPAGSYLCIYHKGHWKKIGQTYEKLFAYAQENHIFLEEVFYEDYILDGLTVKEPEEYVTRISVRIREEG